MNQYSNLSDCSEQLCHLLTKVTVYHNNPNGFLPFQILLKKIL